MYSLLNPDTLSTPHSEQQHGTRVVQGKLLWKNKSRCRKKGAFEKGIEKLMFEYPEVHGDSECSAAVNKGLQVSYCEEWWNTGTQTLG